MQDIELTECPHCSSRRSNRLFAGVDRLYKQPGVFAVEECLECGLRYTNPRPTRKAIARFYPDDYGPYRDEVPLTIELFLNNSSGLRRVKNALKRRVLTKYYGYQIPNKFSETELIEQLPGMVQRLVDKAAYCIFRSQNPRLPAYCRNGKALDIGCGNGVYLAILKKMGWDVTGFDIEDHVAPTIKKEGIPVITGNLEGLRKLQTRYDLITMWHVLEHLHNPLEDLGTIREMLAHSGLILIEVPNSESPDAKLFRSDWYQWDLPRHLIHFTPRSLIRMLKDAGFHIRTLVPLRNSTLPLSLGYWLETRKMREHLMFLTQSKRSQQILRLLDRLYSFGRGGENILVAARANR